jgi:lipoprotein-anchoring transpeptidase ErfK/SrfK
MSRAELIGSRRRRAVAGWCALAAAAALVLGSCQNASPPAAAAPAPSATTSSAPAAAPVPAAQVTVRPDGGTRSARPDRPVSVAADGGVLSSVSLTDARGHRVAGAFTSDRAGWTSTGRLAVRTTYTVRAVATNPAGQQTRRTVSLRTLTPQITADYSLIPSGATEVGVGMPVVVQFDGLVDESRRAAIEKRMSVRTTPAVKGAWGWLDARQLVWRPADYWTPGTRVDVKADIAGLPTRKGAWTTRDASTSFRVGSAMVSTVDVKRHTMTVRRNGKVLRVVPVTTGKAGFATREGVKVILSRESSRQMDAETTGLAKTDPEYYNVKVKYAMRLTWSGEFLHAAPWSVSSQGRANVSHGCTGMSTANARWMFEHSKMGDVVRYVGSSRPLESYNGYTMWNMSLSRWAGHSALA